MTNEKYYRIYKGDTKGDLGGDYGPGYTEVEVKQIVKGYKKDDRFSDDHCTAYTRKNSRFIYFVSEQ